MSANASVLADKRSLPVQDKSSRRGPTLPAESTQISAEATRDSEPIQLPEIGTVVRWKSSSLGGRKGATGIVEKILSEHAGPAIVVRSIPGHEVIISPREYSGFFEKCDSQDPACAFWARYGFRAVAPR